MTDKELGYLKKEGLVAFSSPSNIAIVKYWGKTGVQIPVNPSISFTLKNSVTQTSIAYHIKDNKGGLKFDFAFEDRKNTGFEKKLVTFFSRVQEFFPWLSNFHLNINSRNTFPHSSGIASSASSYSALALCIAKIHQQITGERLCLNDVSNIARLGSGSACRSVYAGWNTWGKSTLNNSDDSYAINLDSDIHPSFQHVQDSILIVSSDKKSISSTVGHQLMENHPYKQGRIEQATEHTQQLVEVLKSGDWKGFMDIAEMEALSLHGLMMSSKPGYTLLHPNSLNIVQQIREFREQNKIDVCFTIDAGPNIHVLYPAANKKRVREFIEDKLLRYCEGNLVIHDELGCGPVEI